MPGNAVELINIPGVAAKATITNIVWVGGGLDGWRWEKFYISKLHSSKGRVKNNDPATPRSDMVAKKVVPVVFIQMFRKG